MAYSTSNPPQVVAQGVGDGVTVWAYKSGDSITTVKGAGYISNGDDLGMKEGDLVLIADTATPASGTAIVDSVAAGGAAELT